MRGRTGVQAALGKRVLTVLGAFGLGAGLVVAGWGLVGFASGVLGQDDAAPVGRYFAMFAAGGLLLVVGLALLNVGTLRARSTYVAEETADAVRLTAGAGGEGPGLRQAGPSCRQCGHQETPGSKFCSNCGTALQVT